MFNMLKRVMGNTKMNETWFLPSRAFISVGKISYSQVTIIKSKRENFQKEGTDNVLWE